MNLENIDYQELEKQLSIQVINNNNFLYCLWIEKEEKILEFSFDHKLLTLQEVDGKIGHAIINSRLTATEKVERCFEALKNGLWDYFHPVQHKKNKLGFR